MAQIASAGLFLLVLIYGGYNAYIYKFRPKKFKGTRFTTKNIAYITVLSAVSVSLTIVVSVTFPITVFPPIRIAFEGLMVKITGYIFGPIIGLMSGIITDGLTLLFVPSYIHIAYLVVVGGFGFLSGIARSLNTAVGRHKWVIMLLTNLFLIFFGVMGAGLTSAYTGGATIELYNGLNISKHVLIFIIGFGIGGTIVFLWLIYFYYLLRYRNASERWRDLLPIIFLAIINEYWVTTLISAWGDVAFLQVSQDSNKGYGVTMIARLAMAPIKIVINVAIIYATYRAIRPLIKNE